MNMIYQGIFNRDNKGCKLYDQVIVVIFNDFQILQLEPFILSSKSHLYSIVI